MCRNFWPSREWVWISCRMCRIFLDNREKSSFTPFILYFLHDNQRLSAECQKILQNLQDFLRVAGVEQGGGRLPFGKSVSVWELPFTEPFSTSPSDAYHSTVALTGALELLIAAPEAYAARRFAAAPSAGCRRCGNSRPPPCCRDGRALRSRRSCRPRG